jgi:hypothetical protein
MKVYQYNDWDENDQPVVKTITDQQILNEYWDYWKGKMVQKFGEGDKLITQENCIDDWIAVNWAWEKKYDEKI